MSKILITGGSGLLGKSISRRLQTMGHEPVWLSRSAGNSGGIRKFKWDPENGVMDIAALNGVEYIIHLAGSGIADRAWTKKYKAQIVSSRVKSADLLLDAVKRSGTRIKTFVGASAIGFYGTEKNNSLSKEQDPPGKDFLSEVCLKWENSYLQMATHAEKTVVLRLGVVLSDKGGALPKLLRPAKMGVVLKFGDGKQYFPWVHLDDAAEIFVSALFNEKIKGTINVVTTRPTTNEEFAETLAKKLNRNYMKISLPKWILKLALGERASTITEGVKIDNEKLKSTGIVFKYDDLGEAIGNLLGR